MDPKSFIVPVITALATILMIASTATGMFTLGDNTYGIFESCNSGVCAKTDLGCDDRENLRKALAAFSILTILAIGFAAIIAILRIFVAALAQGPAKMAVFGLCAVSIFFALFPWIFTSALYDAKICNQVYKDNSGLKFGPQMPLAVIVFILAIVATVVEFMIGQPFAAGSAGGSAPAVASSQ